MIKYFEYAISFTTACCPGAHFTNTELKDPKSDLFFSLYFMMTGLHGIHVTIGMGLIVWLIKRTAKGELDAGLLYPDRVSGLLLALRRHRLDLSLSVTLPGGLTYG